MLEFPTTHRVPRSWLLAHGCTAVRYRTLTDLFPASDPAQADALRPQIELYPPARQIVRKQKDSGAWGGNLLGVTPNKTAGIKDVGTVHQFGRLVELGWGVDSRPIKLGSRILFRLLSRDSDPRLLFEFQKYGECEPGTEPWIRGLLRDAAAAALARSGYADDPRVRGAAHAAANQVSAFLRSELAGQPLVKAGSSWVLNPKATPPTVFSVALLAHLPAVQRERAGLVDRLGVYLSQPAPKRIFGIACGKRVLKQTFVLLGDPLKVTASGQTDDLPFGLYWLELLARLGALRHSLSGARLWTRLLKDCDDRGLWHPRNLRAIPKRVLPWSYAAFPLEADSKSPESRQSDVTFRMGLIARLAGWEVVGT